MLSKEQLEKIANPGPVDVGGAQNPIVTEMATELLALREQLAELKALQPVGYVGNSDLYALSTGDLGCIAPYNAFDGIPLFTAAKPAEDKC
ncbi:hypothetical protein A6J63_015595 [Yersinia enterocolitica]|nr:hypothetical protein A6J63_015595 [Yersinia enterocolitica]